MLEDVNDTVTMIVEGTQVRCSRSVLIANSDYFKAMFEGNFSERYKQEITLNDVDLSAFNIILVMIWEPDFQVPVQNAIKVLDISTMLQFNEVKERCLEQMLQHLNQHNCLRMWMNTEPLGLKRIYLKAKLLSLLHFESIKEQGDFLDLDVHQIRHYLGNRSLQCSSEMSVFTAIIRWYENFDEKETVNVLELIKYLNINELSIESILKYDIVYSNLKVVRVLECVILLKNKDSHIEDMAEEDITMAKMLLQAKGRVFQGFPTMLAVDWEGNSKSKIIIDYDKYKRKKRKCDIKDLDYSNLCVISTDMQTEVVEKLTEVKTEAIFDNLSGFKIVGYMNFIFIFGGEYTIGGGNWNQQVCIYDTLHEKWKYLPSPNFNRRHFEVCVTDGGYIYLIGGTGKFRVVQDTMMWFNPVTYEWSGSPVDLPCSSHQIKCCSCDDRLFLLNINCKLGYLYDHKENRWETIRLCDDNNILPQFSTRLCVFYYNKNLYVKDDSLIELHFVGRNLVIGKEMKIVDSGAYQIESILCGDILCSLHRKHCDDDDNDAIMLELFNVNTQQSTFSLRSGGSAGAFLKIGDKKFRFPESLNICGAFNPILVDKDNYVI